MSLFATELQISNIYDPPRLVAEVIAWLRGVRGSTVLDHSSERDLEGDAPFLQAPGGETLRLARQGLGPDWVAVGFRHDLPDTEGRIWRTEGVLRRDPAQGGILIFRIRGQCLAGAAVTRLEAPRRPHILRAMVEAGVAARDGGFDVHAETHVLSDDGAGLEIAREIIEGRGSERLPVVYLSSAAGAPGLRDREVGRLATDLAGVAHVVAEPSRAFSFRLRDLSAGRNVYGGTIGLAIPGQGFVRRLFLGWSLTSTDALIAAVRAAALDLRTNMGRRGGWDWVDLQEAIIRDQRNRDRNRLSSDEIEKLYQDELVAKDTRIADLQQQINDLQLQLGEAWSRPSGSTGGGEGALFDRLGPEIYPGEHLDRLRAALSFCVEKGVDQGWDRRSLAVFGRGLEILGASGALEELREDLKRATRSQPGDVVKLLARHGYQKKSDNRHIRLEAMAGYVGMEPVTISKTPSDHRASDNLRTQIERALGLEWL